MICEFCGTELDRKNSDIFMSGQAHNLSKCRAVILAKFDEADRARRNASMAVVLAQEIIAKHEATIEKLHPIVVSVGMAPCPVFFLGYDKCGVCLQCRAHAALAPKTSAEYYLEQQGKK